MLDFVISGGRGFIGLHVSNYLKACGFSVLSDREFAGNPQPVRFFVNCGNNANHPIANGALIRGMWHLAAPHAAHFVQISSFVTLHGSGTLDRARPNFGKRPWILDLYAAGKLLQESYLASRREGPVVWFVYLPAVLGRGSNWTQIIIGAQRHGVAGFSDLRPQARPNFIDVRDLGRFLEEKAGSQAKGLPTDAARSPRRYILSRPESRHLTWMQFMGGMTDPTGPVRQAREANTAVSPANRLKNVARVIVMLALGLGWRMGVLQWWERRRNRSEAGFPRYDWPLPPPRPEPEEAVRFRGLTRHLLRTQPYIAELRD